MNTASTLSRLAMSVMLLIVASNALAEDECQLNLNESLLDFGLMSRIAQQDSPLERPLGERRVSLNVSCAQPTDMSLFYQALAATSQRLRFTEHGSYAIQASDAVLDGTAVELGLIPALGQPPVARGALLNWRTGHGIAPVNGETLLNGQHFSVQLTFSAFADIAATRVTDATTWEASGTFHGRHSAREVNLRAHFAPAACKPQLSNGGLVDYGTLLAKDLSPTHENPLPTRTLQFSVNCDAPTPFALLMHDNRSGTATGGTDETAYGLDLDNSGNKIGRYYLNIDPADFTADAYRTLYRTDSTSSGQAWSTSSARQIPIAAHSLMGFTDSAGNTRGPIALQNLAGTVRIKAYLAPTQSMDLRTVVHINGSGTLEIIYL
ncbi:DUF1120 domain-containing protein [Pseudomonas marginalis]